MKLTNNLQHRTTNSFLTTIFKSGLQPYLHVATIGMKRKILQQHKESTLVYEEGIFKVEALNNLLIPQNNKIILA